jgi:hypothetical protein
MNHVHEESKLDRDEETSAGDGEKPESYYYDDATNYETYHDEDDDDNESSENIADD